MFSRTILLIILLFFTNSLYAEYSIKGKVNINDEWQPKIFLAAVKKLSDYYRTSPDMILDTAPINSDGSFELTGNNLPNEKRYYRLYLMKKQNNDYDACLYVGGDDHNFVHVLLQEGDAIEIYANATSVAPFGSYDIQGNIDNQLMHDLAGIVFPSFYFHRIKFPTELKFSENKFHTDLMNFADTCRSTLVALAAINNTDFDEYFDANPEFYQRFGERLKSELPNSIYTKNYLLKIRYYANEEVATSFWMKLLLGLFFLVIIGLLWKLKQANQQLQELKNTDSPTDKALPIRDLLTQKEREILDLISEGKSNKEIASALFIELSTVKTHINKIYSKIGASNRKEAQKLAKQAVK